MDNELELKLAEKLVKIIEKWVGENFGSQEVEDPSWNIEDLATKIAQNGYSLFKIMEREFIKEDINDIALNDNDEPIQLTEDELEEATEIYMDDYEYGGLSDWQIDAMRSAIIGTRERLGSIKSL